jgi:NAD(P)-dependent dehydrogenase (short-subunit alcohol dehydrogenase family)
MELDGRTAVITGAASGIGLALAERCLDEGMSVVMADIEVGTLEQQAARLAEGGRPVVDVACDVSDSDQVEALRDRALEAFGTVHLLVNNAGVAANRPTWKTKPALWRWVIEVDLLGVAYGISAFVPLMVEQGEGHVVNTASEAGLCATPMLGSYHAAKYGVVGLSEALAMEMADTGVGVSCLCPELVDTKVFESSRNAPAELGYRPPAPVDMGQVEQWMGTKAKPPTDVAGDVVYAVRANRFWILTHHVSMARVHGRNADLEALRTPRLHGR